MELNKKKERLGDKAYDLMLIWKQRIGDDVDDHLKNEDPISEVYVGQLIYGFEENAISMHSISMSFARKFNN